MYNIQYLKIYTYSPVTTSSKQHSSISFLKIIKNKKKEKSFIPPKLHKLSGCCMICYYQHQTHQFWHHRRHHKLVGFCMSILHEIYIGEARRSCGTHCNQRTREQFRITQRLIPNKHHAWNVVTTTKICILFKQGDHPKHLDCSPPIEPLLVATT